MAAQVFNDILLKGIRSGKVPARTDDAREWYRKQAKSVSKSEVSDTKIIRELKKDRGVSTTKAVPGSMFAFAYDAKHKATLPYYDKFPLVFPIGPADGGFLGINMHYLPPILRAKLMDALYDTVTNQKYDETTRLNISYKVLSNASKYKEFKPTIKHYLNKQVKSRLLYIAPSEWDIALFLPMANFVGASKQKVYADSRKIIRG